MLRLHETLSESLYQVNCVFAPSLRYLCNLLRSLPPPPVMMSLMNTSFESNFSSIDGELEWIDGIAVLIGDTSNTFLGRLRLSFDIFLF